MVLTVSWLQRTTKRSKRQLHLQRACWKGPKSTALSAWGTSLVWNPDLLYCCFDSVNTSETRIRGFKLSLALSLPIRKYIMQHEKGLLRPLLSTPAVSEQQTGRALWKTLEVFPSVCRAHTLVLGPDLPFQLTQTFSYSLKAPSHSYSTIVTVVQKYHLSFTLKSHLGEE